MSKDFKQIYLRSGSIELEHRRGSRDDVPPRLTTVEAVLLRCLSAHPGAVVTNKGQLARILILTGAEQTEPADRIATRRARLDGDRQRDTAC